MCRCVHSVHVLWVRACVCVCIVCMCARSCESYSRRLLELLSKCLDWTHRDGKSYIVVYCKVVFLPRHFRSFDYTTLASYGSIVKVVIEVRNIATGYLELLIVIYLDLPALMDKIHIACEILCILSWYFEAWTLALMYYWCAVKWQPCYLADIITKVNPLGIQGCHVYTDTVQYYYRVLKNESYKLRHYM